MSTNNDKNDGDSPSDGGDITSTTHKIPPPKDLQNHAHFENSGDGGDGGDIFLFIIIQVEFFDFVFSPLASLVIVISI
jgi:hypothetical protein